MVVCAEEPDLRAQSGVIAELPECSGQIRELMVGVQTARVGQHPECGWAKRFPLATCHCSGPTERRSIGADPEHGDCPWPIPTRFSLESSPPRPQFLLSKLYRACRRSGDQVRDSEPVLQQASLFPGADEPIGEARCLKCGPEPIARSGEVMSGGGRVEPGIDAAEEHIELRRDQVGHRAADRGRDLSLRRSGLHRMTRHFGRLTAI